MNKAISLRQVPQRIFSIFTRTFSSIPDTPVEEPARDPNAPTRDNTNDGDQSPKPNRENSNNNNQDPNQLPKSPKKDR
ncbi:unnamed protein product [Adineta steineri]|uniref:Uncharacterized protein n=1 Tax=Adineta steineri TaxID=433720 RepID=A0A819DYE4_9BILA|nr:unnamed protein product [Adineta steineri]CAF0958224.1 unnamed protein product [Adineta steineri]CAF3752768.1 unnamed protein product [Adineta steineri]CAF3841127.1 unnamed protein product [Adineta steineri]